MSANRNIFRRGVCVTKETQHQPFARMCKIGTGASRHDFSSVQGLLRLLLFLELDRFVNWFVHRLVNRFVFNNLVGVYRRVQLDKPIPHPGDVSTVPEVLWHNMEYGNFSKVSTKKITNCFGREKT